MKLSKEIITQVIVKNSDNEDDVIFSTFNAYDLKNLITFPYGQATTLSLENKFIIDDIEYSLAEITLDIFKPASEKIENNFHVIIYVKKVVV